MSASAPAIPATRPPIGPQTPERLHEVITPEGVPVRFAVALAGDRVGAFILDLLIICALLLVIWIPLALLAGMSLIGGDLVLAGLLLVTFVVRTFYFSFFELNWQGQTPGKRRLRLRVVDARGGPLSADAILVRNLTREVEVFLPLLAFAGPETVYPGAAVLVRVLAGLWMLAFGFLPLFNRDRLRVGDLLAGTVVVRTPDAILLDDLTTRPEVVSPAEQVPPPVFSPEQLDVYGEYELQVLEQVLRGEGTPGHVSAVLAVAERIRKKIGWEGPATHDKLFLQTFYGALRAHLERRMLLGRRRAHKDQRID